MKSKIEGVLIFLSVLVGALIYTFYPNRVKLVSIVGPTMVIAIASILCAGLVYRFFIYRGPGELRQWGMRDLIDATKTSKQAPQFLTKFLAMISIILTTACIFIFGFWTGFFAAHLTLGR